MYDIVMTLDRAGLPDTASIVIDDSEPNAALPPLSTFPDLAKVDDASLAALAGRLKDIVDHVQDSPCLCQSLCVPTLTL